MEKRLRVVGQAALLWQSTNPAGQVGLSDPLLITLVAEWVHFTLVGVV